MAGRGEASPLNGAETTDGLVASLYAVISGDAGVKRDWARFRSLFHPGARLTSSCPPGADGGTGIRSVTPDEYIALSGAYLEGEGFHEIEISRSVLEYGRIAHVFSAYEARHTAKDAAPFVRGINSIQLLFEGERWRILSLAWQEETPQTPIPDPFPA